MYKTALFIGFFLFLAPGFVLAATPSCSAQGYTVVYVNGVFDTYQQALDNSTAFNQKIGFQYQAQPVTVQLGYNPSHLAGAGDLAQSLTQLFNGSISNFDFNTILMQIYPEVTTRKLILVGHSQGSFYTNDMYHYLLANGEPNGAVGVYNVASPAAYTAGGGKYINSSGDSVLNKLRALPLHLDILPNNVDLVPVGDGFIKGHSFTDDYLANAGPQILSDMDSEMSALKPIDASNAGDCYTPPSATLSYKTQAVAFALADPTSKVALEGGIKTLQVGAVAVAAVGKVAVGALQLFADTITVTASPPSPGQADSKTLLIANKLYGSSLDALSPEDKKELLGSSQGGAVALAVTPKTVTPKPKTAPVGIVLGTSTEVADIAAASTTTILVPKNIFPESSNGPIIGGGQGSGGSSAPAPQAAPDPAPVVDETASSTDEASSTVDIAATDTATTTLDDATTTPDVTEATSTPEQPPQDVQPTTPTFSEPFDTYDGSGWHVFQNNPNGTYIKFAFDDGSTGNCRSGGCLDTSNAGSGSLIGGGGQDWMFENTGAGGLSGAYGIWAKVANGIQGARGGMGVCIDVSTDCADSNSFIFFDNVLTADETWHQYYMAWRQGTASVQYCFQIDDVNSADCQWNDTTFPVGTAFNAVTLQGFSRYSITGAEIWFDDLEALSTPQ